MRIIFHLPLDLEHSKIISGVSGSYLRPLKMRQAFEELGCVVDTVWGSASERKKQIQKIKMNVSQGIRYDFIYSESSTMPTLLTEPSHLPISPSIDFGFFRWAKGIGIPVGLFYRDIHWRFDQYKKQVSWLKRCVAVPFYNLDWIFYERLIDYLFLPNLKMLDELPRRWPKDRVFALPPGGELLSAEMPIEHRLQENYPLRLIYVGGVTPPLYNLSLVFGGLAEFSSEQYELTICCRKNDWQNCQESYNIPSNRTIRIVHKQADELKRLYLNSDVALLLFKPFPYWDFVLPLKLFEAICYEIPVLAGAGTAVGDFVEREGVGWVIKPEHNSFQRWLEFIIQNPHEVEKKRHVLKKKAAHHTWRERARTAAKILLGGT
jgi:glycosyltransferase involved in cell wall biosynthesis